MSKQQELLHYKQHPTDFIYGLLSSHVYTDSREGTLVQLPLMPVGLFFNLIMHNIMKS